jgi:hypothetical protein
MACSSQLIRCSELWRFLTIPGAFGLAFGNGPIAAHSVEHRRVAIFGGSKRLTKSAQAICNLGCGDASVSSSMQDHSEGRLT